MMKLQSLSAPSQVSVAGVVAVHADHPAVASHVCVPKHVPTVLVTEQLRIAPASASLHEQLAVMGWQNMPVWPPLASGAHVYPVGHWVAQGVAQWPAPSIVKHAPPPHSTSVAHARHSCGAAGMQSCSSTCGSATVRHSQPVGHASVLHERVHTPPVLPTGSTQ
jgi:hypothetical protein